MKVDETQPRSEPEAGEITASCENCARQWLFQTLRPIRDLHQRVPPGEIMPAGECPECGALCYRELADEGPAAEDCRKWLVQRHNETKAHEVIGSFDDAVRFAKYQCRGNQEQCTIFELPRNVRIATVGREGLRWKVSDWFTNVLPINPEHPEWERMWFSLYCLAGSTSDENPDNGERWQYTGTYWKRRPAIGSLLPVDLLIHEFRHRDRPKDCPPMNGVVRSHGRVTVQLSASHRYSGNWNHPIPEGSLA